MIMRSKQSGFTLVEIAIVLVIIGLLLGGVLKGQELINSAKVKNLINDFRSTSTFVYSYQDRFRAIPGDDAAAVAHVAATALATTHGATGAGGDGRINGAWNSTTTTDETYRFWEQVRLAGLASGTTTIGNPDYIPRNADGGAIGITGEPVITGSAWNGTFFVCSDNIQGRYARQIDTTIDDGNTTTGSVRVIGPAGTAVGTAASATSTTNLTPTEDTTLYVVCVAY
jgi:prepilin-type N-terminal cleavage/methylation domain-containing protein